MGTFSCGHITIEFSNDGKAERILTNGTDIRTIVFQLTSVPSIGRAPVLPDELHQLANQVFDAIDDLVRKGLNTFVALTAADRFFESFTLLPRYLSSFGFQLAASQTWAQLIQWTLVWEKSHSTQIHKGTPFFFLGMNLIFQGDIDTGFLFIYNAMEGDKASYRAMGQADRYKQAPAYMTATIVDNPANVLHETVVRPIRGAISNYVTSFSQATNLPYTLGDFQACFLGNPDLEIEKLVFFFVYNMYVHIQRNRFKQLPQFFDNDFSKIKNLDSIFNMCLIIEELLQHRFGKTGTNYFISDGVLDLVAAKTWITAGKTREETEKQFFSKLAGVDLRLDPSTTVPVILSGNITYGGLPITPELRYLLLAWHLRNYGGHNIRVQDVLVKSYDQIFEWLIYALFIASQPRTEGESS